MDTKVWDDMNTGPMRLVHIVQTHVMKKAVSKGHGSGAAHIGDSRAYLGPI